MLSFHLFDGWELELPEMGLVQIHDSESGETSMVNTSRKSIREAFKKNSQKRFDDLQSFFKTNGLDYLQIRTDQPYVDPLINFFRKRALRVR